MIKNIFYKIMSNDMQRQKMNSLKEQNKIYDLFCENGYTESFDNFKIEMKDFLNSDESSKIINNDSGELSDELLEMVAGGVNVKRALTVGVATLITAFNISTAVGNPIMSGVSAIDDDTSISVSTSASESNSFSNLGEEINNDINNYDMKNSNIDKNQKSSGENGGVQKEAIKSEQSDSVGFEKSKTQSSKEEMASLKQENENLKKQNAEMARLKQENENLKKQNAEMARLKQENENLKKQNAETEKLKQENENLKNQNKNLLDGNKSIEQNKNNQLLNQISELNDTTSGSDNLNKTVETLFNSISKIENSNKEKGNLLNQIKDLQNLINQKMLQQRNLKKENLKLDDMLKQLQSVKNNVNTESDSINKLESQLKEKDSKIKELEGQIGYLNNKLNAAGSNVQRESLDTKQITNKDSIIDFLNSLGDEDKDLISVKENMDNELKIKLSELNEKYNENLKKIENEYNNDFANKIKGGTKEELARKEKEEIARKEREEKERQEKEEIARKEREEKERQEKEKRKRQAENIKDLKMRIREAQKKEEWNEVVDNIKELTSSFNLDNNLKEELSKELLKAAKKLNFNVDNINKSRKETVEKLNKEISNEIQKLYNDTESEGNKLVEDAGVTSKDKNLYTKGILLSLSSFNATNMRKGTKEGQAIKNITEKYTQLGENKDSLDQNIINEINKFYNKDVIALQNEQYKIQFEIIDKERETDEKISEYEELDNADTEKNIQQAEKELEDFTKQKAQRYDELAQDIHKKANVCFKNVIELVNNFEGVQKTDKSILLRDLAKVVNDIAENGSSEMYLIRTLLEQVDISAEQKANLADNLFKLSQNKKDEFKKMVNNLDSKEQEYENKIKKMEDEHIENMKQIISKYNLSDEDNQKFNNFITYSSNEEKVKDLKDGKGNNLLGNVKLKKLSNQDRITKTAQKETERLVKLKEINETMDNARKEMLARQSVFDQLSAKISTLENYIHDKAVVANGLLNKLTDFEKTPAGEKMSGLGDMRIDLMVCRNKLKEQTSKLEKITARIWKENSSGQGLRDFAQQIDRELEDLKTSVDNTIKERVTDNETKLNDYIK